MTRPKVVVVGAGFGGLATVRALGPVAVDVLVVDANNFHTFQPLLYQVATAGLDADDVAHNVRNILTRSHRPREGSVDFRMGTVVGVDLQAREVRLRDGTHLAYDHLVLSAGTVTNDFGVPGVAEHAFGLKSLRDALALRSHLLREFEQADAHGIDHDSHAGRTTVVVAGGGPTGVEMAGALRELIGVVFRRDYRHLDVRRARVVLVEATPELLGPFHARLRRHAARTLERRGVELRLGRSIAEVGPEHVRLSDGEVIATRTVVWAAGVTAHPLAAALGVPLTRGGRVVVEPDLSLPGHPEVFVIGDLAGATDDHGTLLPQVAQVAIQGGRHVAAEIAATLHGARRGAPFAYRDRGMMATIGRNQAVAQFPNGFRLTGLPGWVAWLALHLVYLVGFRNRANVVVNWSWNYLTYDRSARLILDTDGAP